ncbi:MAG: thiol:disulfide interchange protein DsbA/DsbL [Proteobacteria bacterium]|nr:thiol:disulfide interchange protein DsbA/DsbL [Pseudomonadota bacterium]
MRFLLTFLLCFVLLPVQAADNLKAGTDYLELQPPQPVRVPADKIEVVEFFNYSCPHCYRLQGHLAKWRAKHMRDDVVLVQQPLAFTRYNGHYARAHYTLQGLELIETLSSQIYNAIHAERKLINSKGRFLDWLAEEHDVDRERAEKMYDSFTVRSRATRAETIAGDYGVNSTPQLSVNGKYVINPGLSGSYEKLMDTLTTLVERERQARQ